MRRKLKYFYLLPLLISLLAACEKNVEIEIDEIDPLIVMNGLLKADSSVEIALSRTRHILDNKQITGLSDATVTIRDEHGNTAVLQFGEKQNYTSHDMKITRGEKYTVTASSEGFYNASAFCVIPETVPIKYIDTVSTYSEWGEKRIDFSLAIDDPADQINYYMLSVNAYVKSSYFDIVERWDTVYVDPVKDTVIFGWVFDTTEISLSRVEPVWIESEDLAIDLWEYNSNNAFFSDKIFDGRTYTLEGSFYTWFLWDATDSSTIYFNLKSVDEHYYKYVQTREDHYYAKDNPFAVPVVVHSNIENGLGILGGLSSAVDSMRMAPVRPKWEDNMFD